MKPAIFPKWLLAVPCALLLCVPAASGRSVASSDEWSAYGQDPGNMRYSPLRQVTPANVQALAPAWTFHMRPASLDVPAANRQAASPERGRPGGKFIGSEMTPLVVNGLMILATPYRRVVALDATSGMQVWAYDFMGADAPASRGVTYWPGHGREKPRIIVATRGGNLVALDVATGERVRNFGADGIANVKTPDMLNGSPNAFYGFSSPPTVVGDVIVTGGRVQEAPAQGASGDVRGFDVRTGKHLWTFHTIPQPGEPGHDTWEGDSWKRRSGVNVWTTVIGDADRGIVYLPIAAPAFDRWGGDRHGENLFSDSIVAVEARTGKHLWHFQTVHHDIWDLDLPSATLVSVKQNGKAVPAIAVMNKTSILFLLNRVTGKPLFETREVPVPVDTDVPGEKPWPTQPMSVTPPLAKTSYEQGDVANVTPELKSFCEKLIADKHVVPAKPFQPLRTDSAVASFPGSLGGVDWGGAAFDPGRGMLVVNTNNLAALATLIARPDGSFEMKDGYLYFWNPKTRQPCNAPPWGQFSGVDVNTGQIKWQVPLGISEDLPADQRNTGRVNLGNPMVTAGGLAFIGATDDSRFRAFETMTGKLLWDVKLPATASTGPVSYRGKDGRQYIAVVATGGNNAGVPASADDVVAFALPAGH
ncbi:MAG: PQQ-binding-like beta-propeller repeat protein [Alphaproteobacteria bacterium]